MALFFAVAILLLGAGTTTVTDLTRGYYQYIEFDMIADSSGSIDATSSPSQYTGQVMQIVVIPDTTTPPNDNFDIRILDTDSVDVMNGTGLNLDSVLTVSKTVATDSTAYILVSEPLAIKGLNMGQLGKAKIRVKIRAQ